MLKIAMLSTGEEVLHGDIVDTNAAWLAERFFAEGFPLTKRATVGDNQSDLIRELVQLSHVHQIVIVNGGLGPTSDDLSAEAAALASGDALRLFPEWLEQMKAFFAQRHIEMPSSNIKQAMLPESATIVDNPIGTACGFSLRINQCLFYFTPGVPSEFKLMIDQQILPDLKRRYPQQMGLACHRFYTFGASESALSEVLDKVQLPTGYQLGYRAYLPFIEVKVFSPQGDPHCQRMLTIIASLIETYTVSVDMPLIDHLAQQLAQAQLSLATSEQSSAGQLARDLQSHSILRQWHHQGWVLSPAIRHNEQALQEPLAAVLALAGATRMQCKTDLALVTGAVHEQQVTLALATPQGEWGQQLRFRRPYREEEQQILLSTLALDMLRRYLLNKPMFAQYGSVERVSEQFIPASRLG